MWAFDAKIGVLYVTTAKSGPEWFTAGHIELVESIARSTAIALEHVGMLRGWNVSTRTNWCQPK